MRRLSETQWQAVRMAALYGGRLVRVPGGYWTYPGCPMRGERDTVGRDGTAYRTDNGAPEWWVGSQTIDAMVRKGALVVTRERRIPVGYLGSRTGPAEVALDDYWLTDAGIAEVAAYDSSADR